MIDLINPELQELADIERKIEHVARAICKAMGHRPDDQVMCMPPMFGAKDHVLVNRVKSVSSWSLYYREAQAAVEALSEVKA